ncbi:MAG TPA: CRTAC1 family protein [Candidatus Baltobacteraceae bacterium]|nr:CRTAC1 family protein [Candidatus Baltobacteraceae bacterium]
MPRRHTRRDFLNYAAMAAAAPIFEVKPLRGIDFLLQNSPTPRKFLIETMPGGVALFDYNNDGLLDIFLMNGGRITEGLRAPENFERSNPRYWNRLYRQNRDGSFQDVTQAAGLANAGNGNYGMGVAVGDYDNDGNADLYVTSYGKNILYHNNGDGTFTDLTAKAGVGGGGWSVSAGFFDYDNDGKLDLFVTRYMDWDADHNKICGGDWHTYCPPNAFPATTCLLYHNRGDGTFEDVTEKSGLAAKKGRALGVSFADYDGDGFTDIFVANDGMQQYLFHNNGDGTFTECGLESGVAFTADGKGMSGMGTVFQDYDNDGRPDVLVTVLPREIYSLYHNEGGGNFNYASLEAGLGAMTSMSSGWGVGLEDFDNDGWKDLFVAQGHVLDNVQDIDASLRYKEVPLLALNHKGRFERADSGVTKPMAARGVAFGDINNDGYMDAVISCLGGPPVLLLNRGGGTNHWISISLQGTRSNRDGYGARVSVSGQTRMATSTGSYLCANDKRLHFGLGAAEKATVEILWPSGVKQVLNDVRADQFLSVREPERS